MKELMISHLFALLLGLTAPASAAPSFCVQHFNMYGPLYATQIQSRTARVTKELTSENPECDVVQLIEVWKVSQAHQVMDAMSRDYVISAPNLNSRIGLMSLFRGQIDGTETHDFAVNNEDGLLDDVRRVVGVKKAFHVVTAKLPQLDEEIYFVNTHLHPSSQAVRLAQIMDLYQWRLTHQDKKMVLSGDFNAEKDSLERSLLMNLLAAHDSMQEVLGAYPAEFCSYCENNPRSWLRGNHLFDYVFYSNISNAPTSLKAVAGEINLKGENGNTLSDHYGLRVQLEMEPVPESPADLEQRQAAFLSQLDSAIQVLIKENYKGLTPYIDQMSRLYYQIAQKQGEGWNYFLAARSF